MTEYQKPGISESRNNRYAPSGIPKFGDSVLLIFDCDGTLVDSEYLNNKAFTDVLQSYGLTQYTTDYAMQHFVGLTISNIMLQIQMETGFIFPEDTVPRYIRRVEELQHSGLRPIPGALVAVQKLVDAGKRICIGSNGERSNVLRALEMTGLHRFFRDEHVFTKIQVDQPKPAPDLFLYAARQMGAAPERCVVIEDSVTGVTAGVAAGMQVIGFTGAHHAPEKSADILQKAGAHAIAPDFIHIDTLLSL